MTRTLQQLKESVERLIEQQGKYATVAAWIEDVFEMDEENNPTPYPIEIAEEVLYDVEDLDYIHSQILECIYDIISIVETSPKMNNKQQLLETEQQHNKLKKQLETPTIQEAKVGDTLEDGSIVIKKENGLALVVAPKSTEVQCQWSRQFTEVFDKLSSEGFVSSQWFIPSVEQLKLAYKVIPNEINNVLYWSSSENDQEKYIILAAGAFRVHNGIQHSLLNSYTLYVRSVRCISY
jgi:hypothetical protein